MALRRVGWIIAVILLGLAPESDSTPMKMTHMLVQLSGTDIPASSFAARPKEIWRASNQYCRIDEQPDLENGIHGRMIMNEPDVWMVNLADNTARHFVDPGPTFDCKLPIFAEDVDSAKSKVGELEFGREFRFFQVNGATSIDGPKLSFKVDAYELKIGDSTLRLVDRDDTHSPILVAHYRGQRVRQIRYQFWDDQIPFDPSFFAKPTEVTIQESK
jgi:hypothetical protein